MVQSLPESRAGGTAHITPMQGIDKDCKMVDTKDNKADNSGKLTQGDRRAPKTKDETPQGFDTRVGRERGDGWLKKTPGQVIVGRLLGRHSMKNQRNDDGTYRVFYQVRLLDG